MSHAIRAIVHHAMIAVLCMGMVALAPAGIAHAQPSTAPPPAPPPSPGGTGGMPGAAGRQEGAGIRLDLGSLLSAGKGPCERIAERLAVARERLAKRDCARAEAELEAARANLARARSESENERARQAALRAEERARGAQARAAAAALAAAQAQMAAAQQALARAGAAITRALQSRFGVSGDWYQTTQPASGRWHGIAVAPGLTVFMQDDYGPGFWTQPRTQIMQAQIREVLATGAGRAGSDALAAAQAQVQQAEAALALAQANAAAAAAAHEAAVRAAHGLAPPDLPLTAAERRLEEALAALEKCREDLRAQADLIARLENEADECRERIALDAAASAARADAARAAAEAAQEIAAARDRASALARAAGRESGPAASQARSDAGAIRQQAASAETRLRAGQDAARQAEGERRNAQTLAEARQAAAQAQAARAGLLETAGKAREARQAAERAAAEWDTARARTRMAADSAASTRQRVREPRQLDDLAGQLDDLAGQMAEDSARSMLGTMSQTLAMILAAAEGADAIAALPSARLLFLRRFAAFLDAVLGGNEAACWAHGAGVVDAAAGLGGSDQLRGLGYMGQLGQPLCRAFLQAAARPANRAAIRRVRQALIRLTA